MMEMNGRILAEFFADLDPEKSSSFVDISENIRRGVEKVGSRQNYNFDFGAV